MIMTITDLKKLLDRPIAFHRPFVTITGSVNAALMLSQGMYWSSRTSDKDGWFYKTSSEWQEETGMTRREQDTARKYLKNTGFWEEDLRGIPATMYYRIDYEKLMGSMSKSAKLDAPTQPKQAAQDSQTTLYSTETTAETTTTEPIQASGNTPEAFVEDNPHKPESSEPEEKKAGDESKEIYKGFVAAWTEQYKDLGFDAVAGRKIKSMIENTRKDIVGREKVPTVESMLGMFKYVLDYVKRTGHFVHGKPITTFDQQYLSVIFEIRNGKTQPQKKQRVSQFSKYYQR